MAIVIVSGMIALLGTPAVAAWLRSQSAQRGEDDLRNLIGLLNETPSTMASRTELEEVLDKRLRDLARDARIKFTVDRELPTLGFAFVMGIFGIGFGAIWAAQTNIVHAGTPTNVVLVLSGVVFLAMGAVFEVHWFKRAKERDRRREELEKADPLIRWTLSSDHPTTSPTHGAADDAS
jgi:hypothetical protein